MEVLVKPTAAVVVGMLLVCLQAVQGPGEGIGPTIRTCTGEGSGTSPKAGSLDDIPQFSLQMLESMFDYGVQAGGPALRVRDRHCS